MCPLIAVPGLLRLDPQSRTRGTLDDLTTAYHQTRPPVAACERAGSACLGLSSRSSPPDGPMKRTARRSRRSRAACSSPSHYWVPERWSAPCNRACVPEAA